MSVVIPEGFEKGTYSAFSQHIGPLYYKAETNAEGELLGLVGVPLDERHCGVKGRGHGGVLLTVLDEAMGMSAARQLGSKVPTVTISLQTSFMAPTLSGTFLKAEGRVTKMTKSMAFVEGRAWCGDTLVGTANGVWKFLHHLSFDKDNNAK